MKPTSQTQPNLPLLAQLSQRLRIIEESIDTLREHTEMLDKNLIEKHQASVKNIRAVEAELRELRGQIRESQEGFNRLSGHLSLFASKDKLSVLEKYINYLDPMELVNKKEVEEIVRSMLKNKSEEKKI